MKKKNFFGLLMVITLTILSSGCFKRDSMEDIEIVTTGYTLEYIINKLYGEHALINSIYPDGIDIRTYKATEKQLNDSSKKELFIYNGLGQDKTVATELLKRNKNLKIIDGSFGMEYEYGEEELWLNPSHLLMVSRNIRNGLKEYISSTYLKKEIDEKYEEIKVELSELDADIKLTAENASNKTLVVSSNVLKCLEKYGFNIISLEEDENLLQKTIDDVKSMITNGEINYIFMLEFVEQNETIKNIIAETNVETLTLKKLDNITEQERDNKESYLTLMNQNLELLRKELYK